MGLRATRQTMRRLDYIDFSFFINVQEKKNMSPVKNFCSVKFKYHFYDINDSIVFVFLIVVYLFVAQGLMWDLQLQHVNSLLHHVGFSSLTKDRTWTCWQCAVLATGPPGKSLNSTVLKNIYYRNFFLKLSFYFPKSRKIQIL